MHLKPVSEWEVGGVLRGPEHQLSQTRVVPTLLRATVLEEDLYNGDLEHVLVEKFSAVSDVNKEFTSMRDPNHFSVLLEQRGVEWLWGCSAFSRAVADTTPEWQRFLIIFFSSSLRSQAYFQGWEYMRGYLFAG